MEYLDYKIYGNLKSSILFELMSWYGRKLKISNRKINPNKLRSPILLDIGAGTNYKVGWIHADFFQYPLKFWKKHKQRNSPELELDLRYPINCPNNVIDGIYSGHTLEHLYPKEAVFLLKEIYRILKPNCWLRINVPDLEFVVDYYNGKHNDLKYETGCEAISDLCQNWGHRSGWDEKLFTKVLLDVGFINIRRVEFGKDGTDKRLIKEEDVRKIGTLVMEAQKSKQ